VKRSPGRPRRSDGVDDVPEVGRPGTTCAQRGDPSELAYSSLTRMGFESEKAGLNEYFDFIEGGGF
jgi:hypothetical protein